MDEWQTQMQLKSTRRGDVQLYATGLCDQQRRLTGVSTIDAIEDDIDHIKEDLLRFISLMTSSVKSEFEYLTSRTGQLEGSKTSMDSPTMT